MTKIPNLCLFTSLVLLGFSPQSPLSANSAIEVSRHRETVKKIQIIIENLPQDKSFDTSIILEKLKTQIGQPFSQSHFDEDLKMLFEQYDHVEPQIEVQNDEVEISLKLWSRPLLHQIRFRGNNFFKDAVLKKELNLTENTPFNRPYFYQQLSKIKELYIKKGFFELQLSPNIIPSSENNEVDIEISIVEGRRGTIKDIIFNGFTPEEKSKVLNTIYTKKYHPIWTWVKGQGYLLDEVLEQDRLIIINFLQNEGYADAKLDISIIDSEQKDSIILLLNLNRGPQYRYGKIYFTGNLLFNDETLEKKFLIHPNEIYSPEKINQTSDALKELYGKKGYIDTEIQYEIIPDLQEPIYHINFKITEGAQYKIGLVHVFGNKNTQTEVILRESLLVPGEIFNLSRLKASQERLFNIGYFKNVSVYAVKTENDQTLNGNYRDIYIEVEEKATANAALFCGLSYGEGVFGGFSVHDANFNILGLTSLHKNGFSALRGGGEFAQARIQFGSKERMYALTWLTPYFLGTPWRFGVDAYISHTKLQSKSYKIDSFGGSTSASYPLSPYWTLGTKYRFKHAKIDISPTTDPDERAASRTGNVSALSASLNYDSTNSIIKPSKGMRSLFEIEVAGLGGDFDFIKYSYVNTCYQKLWPKGIMKYRWEARFIQPSGRTHLPNSIPLSERLFIGGENTVRGYVPFCLGPQFTTTLNHGEPNPKGGISSSLLSVEYLHEFTSFLDGFVFFDAGGVCLERFHLPKLQMSSGFGVRLNILPNASPISIGLGYPINPENKNQVKRFFASFGTQF